MTAYTPSGSMSASGFSEKRKRNKTPWDAGSRRPAERMQTMSSDVQALIDSVVQQFAFWKNTKDKLTLVDPQAPDAVAVALGNWANIPGALSNAQNACQDFDHLTLQIPDQMLRYHRLRERGIVRLIKEIDEIAAVI